MIKAAALLKCNEKNENILSLNNGKEQNILIETNNGETNEIPDGVLNLAHIMMVNDSFIKEYLTILRENYKHKKADFCFSLEGKTEDEKKNIYQVFDRMIGIVRTLYFSEDMNTLNGFISLSPKAQGFISGGYMELALYKSVKDIVRDISVRYNKSYNIYRNMKVYTKDKVIMNEFDIVIESSDHTVYLLEIKSGRTYKDVCRQAQIARKYGIIPDHYLLIDNYFSKDDCEVGEFFSDIKIRNLLSFKERVEEMLIKDIVPDCHIQRVS